MPHDIQPAGITVQLILLFKLQALNNILNLSGIAPVKLLYLIYVSWISAWRPDVSDGECAGWSENDQDRRPSAEASRGRRSLARLATEGACVYVLEGAKDCAKE